jgi:hypothetical protein
MGHGEGGGFAVPMQVRAAGDCHGSQAVIPALECDDLCVFTKQIADKISDSTSHFQEKII